jgi:glycosyltransferase involved in cell wall biosynthesis
MAQDFPHESVEVIFVDDGSSDNTLSIIESYVPRMGMFVKVFHQEWKGLGVSRNVVVDNAKSKYIIWVDGDMRLSKDFVKKQVDYMEKNPSVGIGKGMYGMYAQQDLVGTLENMEFATTNFARKEKPHSLPLGTGGSTYRVEAIREVGGFDPCIRGSGEDMDAEYRVRKAGWMLGVSEAVFYEKRRKTWGSLWKEYFWHGRSVFYFLRKDRRIFYPSKFWPPIVLATELFRVADAYRLTYSKVALLLPIHYIFKRTAWFSGFLKGLIDNIKYPKS